MTESTHPTNPSRPAGGAAGPTGSHDRPSAVVAIALWVVVLAALVYGIAASASKVVALFGA